jgi:orotidine-5'-phosphate decarboxylase
VTGILISADVDSRDELERIVTATHNLDQVIGYKLGVLCSLSLGLSECSRLVRSHSDKEIIYDHQKAGNDIPDITKRLVSLAEKAGMTGFILFPFAGPEVMQAAIGEGQALGLRMIVGGYMTHPKFIESDGGFIPESLPQRIFDEAARLGVKDFVLPGNRPDVASSYARSLVRTVESPTFWAPGIGKQGGSICALRSKLPINADLIPIVGSSIYESSNPSLEVKRLSCEK